MFLFGKTSMISCFSILMIFASAFAAHKTLIKNKYENIQLSNSLEKIIQEKEIVIEAKEETIKLQEKELKAINLTKEIIKNEFQHLKTKKEKLMQISSEISEMFLTIWQKYIVNDNKRNSAFSIWDEKNQKWEEKDSSMVTINPVIKKNIQFVLTKNSNKFKIFELLNITGNKKEISNKNLPFLTSSNNTIDLSIFVEEESWKKIRWGTIYTEYPFRPYFYGYEVSAKNAENEIIKITFYTHYWNSFVLSDQIKELGKKSKQKEETRKDFYNSLKNVAAKYVGRSEHEELKKEFDNFSDKYIENFKDKWYIKY